LYFRDKKSCGVFVRFRAPLHPILQQLDSCSLVILGTGAAECLWMKERRAFLPVTAVPPSRLVLGEEEIAGLRPRSIGSYIRCRGRDRGFSFRCSRRVLSTPRHTTRAHS
jgi:hypothetical protein